MVRNRRGPEICSFNQAVLEDTWFKPALSFKLSTRSDAAMSSMFVPVTNFKARASATPRHICTHAHAEIQMSIALTNYSRCPPLRPCQVLGVMLAPRDGKSLFHALALQEQGEGEALRQELADFLEVSARHHAQSNAAAAWLDEARRLRDPCQDFWGSHTSIVAYSAMRGRKVVIHTRQARGMCEVQDMSHSIVAADAPTTHILCSGDNHYDALVDVVMGDGFTALQPAWEQPFGMTMTPPSTNTPEDRFQQQRRPLPRTRPPAPLLWASFQMWASAAARQEDIAVHLLLMLSMYVWLVLNNSCPGSFLAELQGILRRTLSEATDLPDWVRGMVHATSFV